MNIPASAADLQSLVVELDEPARLVGGVDWDERDGAQTGARGVLTLVAEHRSLNIPVAVSARVHTQMDRVVHLDIASGSAWPEFVQAAIDFDVVDTGGAECELAISVSVHHEVDSTRQTAQVSLESAWKTVLDQTLVTALHALGGKAASDARKCGERGDGALAERRWLNAIGVWSALGPTGDARLTLAMLGLARHYVEACRPDSARALALRAWRRLCERSAESSDRSADSSDRGLLASMAEQAGMVFHSTGALSLARAAFHRAMELHGGADDKAVRNVLRQLAIISLDAGDSVAAERFVAQSFFRRSSPHFSSSDRVQGLLIRARIAGVRGDTEFATRELKAATEELDEWATHDPGFTSESRARCEMTIEYEKTRLMALAGLPDEASDALSWYRASVAVLPVTDRVRAEVETLRLEATARLESGSLDEAEAAANRAHAQIFASMYDAEHQAGGRSALVEELRRLARIFQALNKPEEAENKLKEAFVLWHAPKEADRDSLATYVQVLSSAAPSRGLCDLEPPGVNMPVEVILDLAELATHSRDQAVSQYLVEQVVAAIASSPDAHPHPSLARAIALRACFLEHEQAIGALVSALQASEDTVGPHHPSRAKVLLQLADRFESIGDHTSAEASLRDARRVLRHQRGTEFASYAAILLKLGELAERRNQPSRSRRLRRLSLRFSLKRMSQRRDRTGLLALAAPAENAARELAVQYARRRMPADAFAYLELAMMSNQVRLLHALEGEYRTQQVFEVLSSEEALETYISIALEYPDVAPQRGDVLAEHIVQRKALTLEFRCNRSPDALRDAEADHEAALTQLAFAQPTSTDSLSARHAEMLSRTIATRMRAIEIGEARRATREQYARHFKRCSLARVRRAIPPGAVLVEWFQYDRVDARPPDAATHVRGSHQRRYGVLVLSNRGRRAIIRDVADTATVDRLVDSYLAAVRFRGHTRQAVLELLPDRERDASDDVELWQLLAVPILAAARKRKHLLISPAGSLAKLPFEILRSPKGRYLIEDFTISYLNAGRDVIAHGNSVSKHADAGPPLIVASPDFDLALAEPEDDEESEVPGRATLGVGPFRPIPAAMEEGLAVAGMLGVTPFTGAGAVGSLLHESARPIVLHLATHGFFLSVQGGEPTTSSESAVSGKRSQSRWRQLQQLDDPLQRAGLAFAGANSWLLGRAMPPAADDAIMSAYKVARMDLRDTQLAVLSACETGLGDVFGAEGVFGFRRAFTIAGVKTLVMSLWRVSDAPTSVLMKTFYALLREGCTCAQALREAQLRLLALYRDQPAVWGAFDCVGAWGPVRVPAWDGSTESRDTAAGPVT